MKPKTWTLPKFKQCAKAINTDGILDQEEVLAGILERLWFTVGTFDPYGGKVSDFYFHDRPQLAELLLEFRWIDEVDGVFFVHDWVDHRPEYVNKLIRDREYQRERRNSTKDDVARHRTTSHDIVKNRQGSCKIGKDRAHSDSDSDSSLPSEGSIDVDRTVDQISVSVEEIQKLAQRLFDAIGYRGDNGRQIWKIAAALHAGLLCDADVWGLAEVAAERKNPPAYLYASLRQNLQEIDHDLQTIFKQITITPKWPKEYPHAS